MRTVQVRNVSEAWSMLPAILAAGAQEEEETRAGRVLVLPQPVTTTYERPTERVLFCPRRDANPFFHLVEALWMLAGRNDAATLNRYVADFGERFGEPDGTIHGAYGHRWRQSLGYDQLEVVVQKLRANPQDRQAVIQMWDAQEMRLPLTGNMIFGPEDLRGTWRDRPCNTHVYLRVRTETNVRGGDRCDNRLLDLTVCCRSNDAVWGAYGANAVHFSVLQEYLAARIGCEVGVLHQVSNNFHVYRDVWDRVRPSDAESAEAAEVTLGCAPMFTAPEWIDRDLADFFEWHSSMWAGGADKRFVCHNAWFRNTAERVARSWFSHRARRSVEAARAGALAIECPAWKAACYEWLGRRMTRAV